MRHVLVPKLISPGEPPRGQVHVIQGNSMGTSWSVRFVAPASYPSALAREAAQRELDLVVAQMSHWEASSNLSRYNAAAVGTWHVLPQEFFEVLECALDVAKQSSGAYDPAAGALVNLWGFGPDSRYRQAGYVTPTTEEIAQSLSQGNWQGIALDARQRAVLQPGGVQLDFSSIAKGYGVDRVAHCLDEHDIHHYLVEVGGELRGAGIKPDGQPWWVGIEQPPDRGSGSALDETLLALHGLSVASSGDYRRFADVGGQRFSHTLDPRTGHPIDNKVASVTVIHPSCMQADALSTALTVLGVEQGMHLAEEKNLAARFVMRDDEGLREVATKTWREMLQ